MGKTRLLPCPTEKPKCRFSSMTKPLQHFYNQIMIDPTFIKNRLHVSIQSEQFINHLAHLFNFLRISARIHTNNLTSTTFINITQMRISI
ncbi:LOW QUALITY PROTEIN: hypothetical protein CFOL_v3_30814, partial [Cephalotus follicularis]